MVTTRTCHSLASVETCHKLFCLKLLPPVWALQDWWKCEAGTLRAVCNQRDLVVAYLSASYCKHLHMRQLLLVICLYEVKYYWVDMTHCLCLLSMGFTGWFSQNSRLSVLKASMKTNFKL